jgi:hypothetical protein
MPPPPPFFIGRTIDATERDEFLQVRSLPGHAFSSPPRARILQLELTRLLSISREEGEAEGWAQIAFTGDLKPSGYDERVVLGPVDPGDADALVAAVSARYGLPRVPHPCSIPALLLDAGHARAGNFVVTTGTYEDSGHFESADFDGIRIVGDKARRAVLVSGQRFVVTGFVQPGMQPGDVPCPGYNGVRIHAMSITPEILPKAPSTPAAVTAPGQLWQGHTVNAAMGERGYLVFSAIHANVLWPPSNPTLYLQAARIIRADVEPIGHPGWVALRFHGEFSENGLPNEVRLAPLAEDDARALGTLLGERLGLPRQPRPVQPYELTAVPPKLDRDAYITFVARQEAPGHFEGPDFAGVKLIGVSEQMANRTPGKCYLVTGLYQPPLPRQKAGNYLGAQVRIMTMSAEPDGPRRAVIPSSVPQSSSIRGPVLALLQPSEERGHQQLEFSSRVDPATLVVGALGGSGAQGTSDTAAHLSQLALATALAEPAYAPLLGPPIEPPASLFTDPAAWAAWLADRAPLPAEPAALATALGQRIGHVLEGANLRNYCLGADGILAVVSAGRATLLRRGIARAYLLRGGVLQTLIHEDTLGRAPEYVAQIEQQPELAAHRWVPVSTFVPIEGPTTTPPLEIIVQRGDRLIFAVGPALVQALDDPAREALLGASPPDVVAGMPPTEEMIERGWGVIAVDIDGAIMG